MSHTIQLCPKLRNAYVIGVISIIVILVSECSGAQYQAINCRKHKAVLTDFGAVGDGKTSNTKAFNEAIKKLSQKANDGGALLVVPPGKWLTGSFNLTSYFTLFLEKGAVILASQDESEYPSLPVLPSHFSPDAPSRRFSSLIFGTLLHDVIITGNNGTIDGQGAYWWGKFKKKKLTFNRPNLIEILNSKEIQISHLTLVNSPSLFVHPVYSSNIIIQRLTINAPVDSPNTDGITPDSCTNIKIEDISIISGDDCISVKSGLDECGVMCGRPTQNVIIRKVFCKSPRGAMIALGSEMSGGIQNVRAEDMKAIDSESAFAIRTTATRGGYVKDVFVKGMTVKTLKYVFYMTGAYGSKGNSRGVSRQKVPTISGINLRDITGSDVSYSASLDGIKDFPFKGICISDVSIGLSKAKKRDQWNCKNIGGIASNVSPKPCSLLVEKKEYKCPYPSDKLPIDNVRFKTCSF